MNNGINDVFDIIQALLGLSMVIVTLVYIVITYRTLKVTRFQTNKSIEQNLQSLRLSLVKLKLEYLNMDKNAQISEALVIIETEIKKVEKQLQEL